MRRSARAGNEERVTARLDYWSRPLPVRVIGWSLLLGAALLILGGAYRVQSNMISTGLLFLAMGVFFAPDTLRRGWTIKVALAALVAVGAIYTLIT